MSIINSLEAQHCIEKWKKKKLADALSMIHYA